MKSKWAIIILAPFSCTTVVCVSLFFPFLNETYNHYIRYWEGGKDQIWSLMPKINKTAMRRNVTLLFIHKQATCYCIINTFVCMDGCKFVSGSVLWMQHYMYLCTLQYLDKRLHCINAGYNVCILCLQMCICFNKGITNLYSLYVVFFQVEVSVCPYFVSFPYFIHVLWFIWISWYMCCQKIGLY